MRILGAVFIFAACLCIGACYSESGRKRIMCLKAALRDFSLLKAELSTRLLPLPELAEGLKDESEFFGCLYINLYNLGREDFSSIWERACLKCFSELKNEELGSAAALGRILGRYELQEQLQSIDRLLEYFENLIAEAGQRYPEQRKLSLGISAAAAMFILLGLI